MCISTIIPSSPRIFCVLGSVAAAFAHPNQKRCTAQCNLTKSTCSYCFQTRYWGKELIEIKIIFVILYSTESEGYATRIVYYRNTVPWSWRYTLSLLQFLGQHLQHYDGSRYSQLMHSVHICLTKRNAAPILTPRLPVCSSQHRAACSAYVTPFTILHIRSWLNIRVKSLEHAQVGKSESP